MPLSLGQILQKSFADFRLLFRPLALGAVILGLLLSLSAFQAQHAMEKQLYSLVGEAGEDVSLSEMQDLILRMQQGDQRAVEELGTLMQAVEENPPEASAALVGSVFAFAVLMWLLTALGSFYYLTVAAGGHTESREALQALRKKIIPLIGLSIWIGIRSFVWVPFVGVICAVVLMPRFILAPVLLIREDKGVFESARLSFRRTRSCWLKVLSYSIVALFCGLTVYIGIGIALRAVGAFSMLLAGALGSVLGQFIFAYFAVFTVVLALAVPAEKAAPQEAAV